MKAEVDRAQCFSFLRCIKTAPSVFWLDDDGETNGGPFADADLESVKLAAKTCPMMAIRVLDDEGRDLGVGHAGE